MKTSRDSRHAKATFSGIQLLLSQSCSWVALPTHPPAANGKVLIGSLNRNWLGYPFFACFWFHIWYLPKSHNKEIIQQNGTLL